MKLERQKKKNSQKGETDPQNENQKNEKESKTGMSKK